jgi:hypothetical protein
MGSPLIDPLTAAASADAAPLPPDDEHMPRDQWIHDFRNALGNASIAASAARYEIAHGQSGQMDVLMQRIEEGCERCLQLLRTMPL